MAQLLNHDDDDMPAEIDFSKGVRGKFYSPNARSLDQLIGAPLPRRKGRRGPASRLQQQIEAVEQLPRTKQQFVSQMLDTVLAQAQTR